MGSYQVPAGASMCVTLALGMYQKSTVKGLEREGSPKGPVGPAVAIV